ncbi:MAG: helix-turn-helix domain-containing protein [Armatimonadota bacterium]
MAGARVPGYRDPLAQRDERRLSGLVNIPRHAETDAERATPLDTEVHLPASFIAHVWPRLSLAARGVLIPLIQLWGAQGAIPYRVTVPEIAARAGLSQPTVRKAIRELEEVGIISLTPCEMGIKDGHLYTVNDLNILVGT